MLRSRRGYRRAWLAPDAFAAVMLLVIAVPEQLATSRLAGMPPITGLYAFVAGTALFALLGSNPQLSVGADSTIAPLFAVGIAHLAPTGSKDYVALVSLLAVVVGVLVALVGLLRLGWVAEFLSLPIVTGFLAGVAVIIVVHQLPDLLGLPAASGTTLHRVGVIAGHLGEVNGWTLGIGVAVLGIVLAAERIDKKVPGALIGLVGSTVVVRAAGLRGHGVAVLGTLAHGAPQFGLHDVSWASLGHVMPVAGVVALVVLSQSAATTRAFADQGAYDVDVTRDFLGVGAGNIVSGLAGSFAVNASPARTAVVAGAGGRSQIATLGAAAAVVALVPAAGLLTDVPLATLAAVLIFVATRDLPHPPARRRAALRPLRVRPGAGDVAGGGVHRGRAGHRGGRGARHPRPHAHLGTTTVVRARPDPLHDQLGAARTPRAPRGGPRCRRLPVPRPPLLRQ